MTVTLTAALELFLTALLTVLAANWLLAELMPRVWAKNPNIQMSMI